LAQVIQDATKQYSKEVKEGIFPQEVNTYKWK
jgi:ketopantoate hydroxymethyltransferase